MSARANAILPLLSSLALLVLGPGCAFDTAGTLVPSYACGTTAECSAPETTCLEHVCAAKAGPSASIIVQIAEPDVGFTAGPAIHTFDAFFLSSSEAHDLDFPTPRAIFGLVRYDDGTGTATHPVEANLSFARVDAVAGEFVDEVRVSAPTTYATSPDGMASDYGVNVAATSAHRIVVSPTMGTTPSWASVPQGFVGAPASDVFPPVILELGSDPSAAATRLDFVYPATLFSACDSINSVMCSASGTLLSSAAGDIDRPEADVRVVLEDLATGLPVSTPAVTGADGTFTLRISDARGPTRLRISGSAARRAYPTFAMDTGVFDPLNPGNVVVPRFDVVRYVGRVEHDGAPVPDALVRAFSTSVVSVDGVPVIGGEFDATVRTTIDSATDGPGYFAVDLVEGDYDLVASDVASSTSLVLTQVTVSPPAGGGSQAGQTFVLGPAAHLAGSVAGPDGRALPYATAEARPVVATDVPATPRTYARLASATTDVGGAFDLGVDPGVYDLVFSLSSAEGLPVFVLPETRIDFEPSTPSWLPVTIPAPAVVYGTTRTSDGSIVPHARVSLYLRIPASNTRLATTLSLGDTIADDDGHYRLLVPSTITLP